MRKNGRIDLLTHDMNVKIVLIPRDPVTICEIRKLDGSLLSYGISRRKIGNRFPAWKAELARHIGLILPTEDEYDEVIGMKLALKSATSKLDTDAETKASIWAAFLMVYPPSGHKNK